MGKETEPLAGYLLLGLTAGFASSLFGIGGGLVIVPCLTLFFAFGIKEAAGTSLAGIIPISAVGLATEAIFHGENIFWATAALLTCGSILGARLGSIIVSRIREKHLRFLFACFVLLAAVKMFGFIDFGGDGTGLSPEKNMVLYGGGALGTGLLAGICSVLFGIGGGIVVVPFLTFFFADFDFHQARATSLGVILPTSLAGAFLHRKMKNVRWNAVKRIVPLALAGSVTGVIVANLMGALSLKRIFGALLLLCCVRLFRGRR